MLTNLAILCECERLMNECEYCSIEYLDLYHVWLSALTRMGLERCRKYDYAIRDYGTGCGPQPSFLPVAREGVQHATAD